MYKTLIVRYPSSANTEESKSQDEKKIVWEEKPNKTCCNIGFYAGFVKESICLRIQAVTNEYLDILNKEVGQLKGAEPPQKQIILPNDEIGANASATNKSGHGLIGKFNARSTALRRFLAGLAILSPNEPQQAYKIPLTKLHTTLTQDTKASPASCNTPISNSLPLPKITIPKFDGDYRKWRQFYDLFLHMIHLQPIPNVQKMWYLKSNFTGEAELGCAK
uniref:Uncharacterized protein n=1 Tax=Glossina morsitans morsitans TaxID=37546 RepID=A0A1B0G5Z8_GLOMM